MDVARQRAEAAKTLLKRRRERESSELPVGACDPPLQAITDELARSPWLDTLVICALEPGVSAG